MRLWNAHVILWTFIFCHKCSKWSVLLLRMKIKKSYCGAQNCSSPHLLISRLESSVFQTKLTKMLKRTQKECTIIFVSIYIWRRISCAWNCICNHEPQSRRTKLHLMDSRVSLLGKIWVYNNVFDITDCCWLLTLSVNNQRFFLSRMYIYMFDHCMLHGFWQMSILFRYCYTDKHVKMFSN